MGAIALSSDDESLVIRIQKTLSLSSKAQVVHQALKEFQKMIERRKLARDIQSSVMKCAESDLVEHQVMTKSAVYRSRKTS